MLDDKEKEIVECLVKGWIDSDCALYGGLSYQCVSDLLIKIGAPESAKIVSEHIDAAEQRYNAIAEKAGMRTKPWIDTEGPGAPTRADEIFKDAVDGLLEHHPCLKYPAVVRELRSLVQVPDTGNNQLDYENVRDQVEKMAEAEGRKPYYEQEPSGQTCCVSGTSVRPTCYKWLGESMNEQQLARLGVILSQEYYSHPEGTGAGVKSRFDSGQLTFRIGENNWPEGWYTDPYFNVSVPVALDLAQVLPEVKSFRLWYQKEIDFHNIVFDYDGNTYCVQWYKIFTVHRKSDSKKVYMESRHTIADFFKSGRHKTSPHWDRGSELYCPFNWKN